LYDSWRWREIALTVEAVRPFLGAPMPDFRMSCPNTACAKRLLIPLRPGAKNCKARCSACRTVFRITLATPAEDNTPIAPIAPHGPATDDDESGGGSYGLAEENSLTYLLRREQDGFKLSAQEKATKRRLIDEKLAADPEHCPACEGPMAWDAVVCVACGLNLQTGKRLKTVVERPEKKPVEDGGESNAGEVLGEIAELIIDILGDG